MTDTPDARTPRVTNWPALLRWVTPGFIPLIQQIKAEYGNDLARLCSEDLWHWAHRLQSGDPAAPADFFTTLSDIDFITRVVTNSARWGAVAASNVATHDQAASFISSLGPALLQLILGMLIF